jgi:hypothetical protein
MLGPLTDKKICENNNNKTHVAQQLTRHVSSLQKQGCNENPSALCHFLRSQLLELRVRIP